MTADKRIGFRRLRITGDLLVAFFTPGDHKAYEVIENGLPSDARVVETLYDVTTGLLSITIASASFNGPDEGMHIQDLPPVLVTQRSSE